jgi:hypothetical protein
MDVFLVGAGLKPAPTAWHRRLEKKRILNIEHRILNEEGERKRTKGSRGVGASSRACPDKTGKSYAEM